MTSRIEIESDLDGRMTSRETAILLYGALHALHGLLSPAHAAGTARVLDWAARSLWPQEAEDRPEPPARSYREPWSLAPDQPPAADPQGAAP